jgi:sterol desaturase/sphingolipid hydroxylase (fatty acid hydroxylase superfamily)
MIDPASSLLVAWLQCLAVVAGVSLVSTGIGAGLERWPSGRRRVWAIEVSRAQRRAERRRYAAFVLVLASLATLWLRADLIRFGGEGIAHAALSFGLVWVAFEVYYYGLHRLLHTRAFYRFHAAHHESRVTTAWSGQSLGLIEALGWMAGLLVLPALIGLAVPLSPAGCLAYFVANTFVNVAGHANVELNPLSRRGLTWLVHPWTYHALHHARFQRNYSFASTFMDRLFGTEWADWPELHAQVFAGQALKSLNARGPGATSPPPRSARAASRS